MPRLLVHFARYGPYHHARLRSAHEALSPLGWEVLGLEIASSDETYAWAHASAVEGGPQVITAFPERVHEELTSADYNNVLLPLLDSLSPSAMAIAGWGSTDALICQRWCRKRDVYRVVMSETRAADGHRVWWKELAKRYLVSRFDGAMVGGKTHRDYLVMLGMKSEQIVDGYNVIDNEYFAAKKKCFDTDDRSDVEKDHANLTQPLNILSPTSKFCAPYFLASNRFIERKNLLGLIESYAMYVERAGSPATDHKQTKSSVYPLCLLGDGEQKPALITRCKELGLHVIESAPWEKSSSFERKELEPQTVFFPGFRQIEELPRFYAHACCFIHPALEEPWGLVINEAMACGLPVLSSRSVGAAESLVEDGVNGWIFDATDANTLADLMLRVSSSDFPAERFANSSRRILEMRAPTAAFGSGLKQLLDNLPIPS